MQLDLEHVRTRRALSISTQLHVGEKCVGEPEMIEGTFANVSQFKEAVKFKLKEALARHRRLPALRVPE